MSYTIFFRLKLFRKSYLVFAKILAITEADDEKMKEKSLFDIDPAKFIKLKGYKVIPKDSSSSNIMKILFPRKKSNEKQLRSHLKKLAKTNDEPMTSSARDQTIKDLQKDFIEVDDVLLVRDPSSVQSLLKNELSDEEPDQTPPTKYYQVDDRKPSSRAVDLILNRSLRLQKSDDGLNLSKTGSLNRLFQPSGDRELFKREHTAKKADMPIEDTSNSGDATRTERTTDENRANTRDDTRSETKSEEKSIESSTDSRDDSTKAGRVTPTVNDENETSDAVKGQLEPNDTEASDQATSTDDIKALPTESTRDMTENVSDSNRAESNDQMDEATSESVQDSNAAETITESSQQTIEVTFKTSNSIKLNETDK